MDPQSWRVEMRWAKWRGIGGKDITQRAYSNASHLSSVGCQPFTNPDRNICSSTPFPLISQFHPSALDPENSLSSHLISFHLALLLSFSQANRVKALFLWYEEGACSS
uniref:Uncharacterized protein n=1 Tax=Opuntia streptacantha TaxID=393608 RepID=A0A7C8ZY68_OPUST